MLQFKASFLVFSYHGGCEFLPSPQKVSEKKVSARCCSQQDLSRIKGMPNGSLKVSVLGRPCCVWPFPVPVREAGWWEFHLCSAAVGDGHLARESKLVPVCCCTLLKSNKTLQGFSVSEGMRTRFRSVGDVDVWNQL